MIKGLSIIAAWIGGLALIIYGIAELTSWQAYPILGGLALLAWGGYKPLWRLFVHGGAILNGVSGKGS